MLTLDDIRNSISQLSKLDAKDFQKIESGVSDIFYDLLYADQPVFILLENDKPFFQTIASDHNHSFLRLFSHQELAENALSKYPQCTIREYNFMEVLQIGYWSLLNGCYGFILNEGNKWVIIPITGLLEIFFVRIYNHPELYDDSYAKLCLFLSELKINSVFQYGAEISDNEEWNGIIARQEYSHNKVKPISIQSVFNIQQDTIQIFTDRGTLEITQNQLFDALDRCGIIQPENTDLFVDAFEDFNQPITEEDWHILDISEIAMKEREKTENSTGESPEQNTESAESTETRSENTGEVTVDNLPEKIKDNGSISISFNFKNFIQNVKQKISDKNLPNIPFKRKLQIFVKEKEDKNLSDTGIKTKKQRKIPVKIISIILILCLMTGGITVAEILHKTKLNEFCGYVDNQEYGKAYNLYGEMKRTSDANTYLSAHLDNIVLKYANNNISAEELFSSMKSLDHFACLEQDLIVARLTASKLESSKNAYVTGKNADNTFEKLDIWRQVLELDSVNYNAVLRYVDENSEENLRDLNQEIERYSTKVRAFARERYDVMAYWYPEASQTLAWSKTYAVEPDEPLSIYPISVNHVAVRQKPTGYWTLTIDWKNTSSKTIDKIIFSVVAIDENGEFISSTDSHGSWMIYDAQDVSQYLPDEGPTQAEYGWSNVFYGSRIADARVTAIEIFYSDGSSALYTSEVDLTAIGVAV